ncbi:MAG: zinc ribbon domain-containing protein [Candidatus Thermoplasmatota archaeon]|nr:zinc ribbon domain-containing protein [Candidatus Thermoplasmatota archaeon]
MGSTAAVAAAIPRSSAKKKKIFLLGILLLVIGIVLSIIGLLGVVSSFTNIGFNFNQIFDQQSFAQQSQQMSQTSGNALVSGIIFAIGLILCMFGGYLIFFSKLGNVASYVANETAPAVGTVTHAVGKGLMSGVNEAGGIQLNVQGMSGKEVIKVKCSHCGYLESEDAEFCSKCGKPL